MNRQPRLYIAVVPTRSLAGYVDDQGMPKNPVISALFRSSRPIGACCKYVKKAEIF